MTSIDERLMPLLEVRLPFHGGEHTATLRVVTTANIFPAIFEKEHRSESTMRMVFETEIYYLIDRLDGKEIELKTAEGIVNDPESFGTIMAARNRLLESLSEQGRMFAQCPHCRSQEIELGVAVLTLGLDAAPWPIVDPLDRLFLMLPSLAAPLERGMRPAGVPVSSRIRFELPSFRFGLQEKTKGGVLGDLDPIRETEARTRWDRSLQEQTPSELDEEEDDDDTIDVGTTFWTYERPGFRALLRLCAALESLDGVEGEISPASLAVLPSPDFFYLDNLYYLTHNVDIPDGSRMIMACPGCGEKFLPVR